jgi:hypothetical protein
MRIARLHWNEREGWRTQGQQLEKQADLALFFGER